MRVTLIAILICSMSKRLQLVEMCVCSAVHLESLDDRRSSTRLRSLDHQQSVWRYEAKVLALSDTKAVWWTIHGLCVYEHSAVVHAPVPNLGQQQLLTVAVVHAADGFELRERYEVAVRGAHLEAEVLDAGRDARGRLPLEVHCTKRRRGRWLSTRRAAAAGAATRLDARLRRRKLPLDSTRGVRVGSCH